MISRIFSHSTSPLCTVFVSLGETSRIMHIALNSIERHHPHAAWRRAGEKFLFSAFWIANFSRSHHRSQLELNTMKIANNNRDDVEGLVHNTTLMATTRFSILSKSSSLRRGRLMLENLKSSSVTRISWDLGQPRNSHSSTFLSIICPSLFDDVKKNAPLARYSNAKCTYTRCGEDREEGSANFSENLKITRWKMLPTNIVDKKFEWKHQWQFFEKQVICKVEKMDFAGLI